MPSPLSCVWTSQAGNKSCRKNIMSNDIIIIQAKARSPFATTVGACVLATPSPATVTIVTVDVAGKHATTVHPIDASNWTILSASNALQI
jgi:hypothetical protein